MVDAIVQSLAGIPPAIATVILASLPVAELRLAIPIAANVWEVPPFDALGLAILGNMIPFFPLYFGLDAVRTWSEKYVPWFKRLLDRSIERAEKRVQEKYARYGAFALFLFTALPLPLTGLWTATLAAVALRIPFRHAFYGIFAGVCTAGVIVLLLSVSADVYF